MCWIVCVGIFNIELFRSIELFWNEIKEKCCDDQIYLWIELIDTLLGCVEMC